MTVPTPRSPIPRIRLDAPSFRAWLDGWFDPALALGPGWSLDDVHPFGPWEIALAFVRSEAPRTARLKVRLRNDAAPAAARTEQLDVLYRAADGEIDDAGLAAGLAQKLAEAIAAREAEVRFEGERPRLAHAEPSKGPPPAFNLAIPGPCHQKCSFCGVREELKPVSAAPDGYVERLRGDLERSAGQGTRVLRVNGIEPLAAPYVWELLDHARDVGFEEFHILSTFRPLADPALSERLLDAMPARYRFYVPIYGSRAELHDAATGAPGSFEETLRAVEQLREAMDARGDTAGEQPRGHLLVTTILMRSNLADAHAMAALVAELTQAWEIHLPFPNTSSRHDPYRRVTIRMTDALDALAPERLWPAGEIPIGEITPCVALAHERRTGHVQLTAARLDGRRVEPSGTFYESVGFTHSLGGGRAIAFSSATTPCPHAADCALAAACPQKVYTAYAEEHGLDELWPVGADDLAGLERGPEVRAWVDRQSS